MRETPMREYYDIITSFLHTHTHICAQAHTHSLQYIKQQFQAR